MGLGDPGGDGSNGSWSGGSDGDDGGTGPSVNFTTSSAISATGNSSAGIWVFSLGGSGGSGGDSGTFTSAGDAGSGGDGGAIDITVQSGAVIHANGPLAAGIFAASTGADGGDGGDDDTLGTGGGDGGAGGNGGTINIVNTGQVVVSGLAANGIYAASEGGGGGSGGGKDSVFSFGDGGGGGEAGNSGADVSASNAGSIQTSGDQSAAVLLLSVGGNGGDGGGGASLIYALGGSGGQGGAGEDITFSNTGTIVTLGNYSHGLGAHSVGGGGGAGGSVVDVSLFIGVAIGGSAGGGGYAGDVTASNNGSISTAGAGSKGISAMSVGGGGGDGGNATAVAVDAGVSIAVSIGGSGGFGGDGGAVSVTNEVGGKVATGVPADPTTPVAAGTEPIPGDHAVGILAQSIGGGGGSGGLATAVAVAASDEASLAVSVGLGGSGGSGGDGDAVTVINDGSIETHARLAHGVVAQSIGGGGGNGGNSVAVAASVGEVSGSVTVGLGGNGGDGGSGGEVSVTHSGSISTLSSHSSGIVAQSIGGGGGNGGSVLDVAAGVGNDSASIGVALGGKGGDGGVGDDVSVDDQAGSTIITAGHQSHGIVAQSIGGGGGTGGNVNSYGFSVNAGSGIAATANVDIGGNGGSGNVGGSASASIDGSIATSGDDAKGVIVQSIGGGGGNGGNAFELSVAATINAQGEGSSNSGQGRALSASVGVGGTGGTGNIGGTAEVSLDSNASISTQGVRSTGILVQSIGGGGGNGGSARSLAVSTSVPTSASTFGYLLNPFNMWIVRQFTGEKSKTKGSFQASVSVGGNGGSGADGGKAGIEVSPGASISTTGDQAHGVHVQSIGGGGGAGGNASSDGLVGISSKSIEIAIGGNGGASGNGGHVRIAPPDGNEGGATITTAGSSAHGIFLQSIGGGGGEGGDATSNPHKIPRLSGASIQIGVGGTGGSYGKGGRISYQSNDNISTSGATSFAIFAQSVGGGGGAAHVSADTISDGDGDGGDAKDSGMFEVSVGGQGASGGAGGKIEIDGQSSLKTTGDGSAAIFAQSVGGGGGSAGIASGGSSRLQSVTPNFSLGGGGDGAGGNISIRRGGTITTEGDVAPGIFAQSVGGGGGSIHLANIEGLFRNPGSINYELSNADGGNVTISDLGGSDSLSISTTGDGSHGIVAQSIGSGGGAIIMDIGSDAVDLNLLSGTSSGSGQAGNVAVTLNGSIATSGDAAYGVVAQTFNGQVVAMTTDGFMHFGVPSTSFGTASVSLLAGSSVTTTGALAHGVVVDSFNATVSIAGAVNVSGSGSWGTHFDGYQGSPSISVEAGGSVSATGLAEGGIFVGSQATGAQIDVYGSVNAVDATAIKFLASNNGYVTVHQDGVVQGDIVGTGTGMTASGLHLRNNGSITGSVSGVSRYSFGGGMDGGMHYLMFDPTGEPSDSISVLDLRANNGQVVPLLTQLPTSDFQQATLVSIFYGAPAAPVASTPDNLAMFGLGTGTLSTNYTYDLTGTTATVTGASVDFTRAGLSGNDGQLATLATAQLGEWAANTQPGGSDAALESILLAAANATTTQQLSQSLEALDATAHFAPVQSSAGASSAAHSNMQSCGDSSAAFALIAQGNCNWGKGTYAVTYLRGGDQRDRSVGLSVGSQHRAAADVFVGGSLGIEDTDFSSTYGGSEGNRVSLGGIVKYVKGPVYGSAALLGSHSWAEATRHSPVAGFTGVATADQSTSDLSMRLRGAYVFERGALGIMPLVDFDLMAIHDDGYTETGMGMLNMQVESSTNVLADVRPALRLGTTVLLGGAYVTSYIEAGAKFALNEGEIETSMIGGANPGAIATLDLERDPVVGTFAASTTIDWGALEVRALYEGSAGEETTSHAGSLKLAWTF